MSVKNHNYKIRTLTPFWLLKSVLKQLIATFTWNDTEQVLQSESRFPYTF